MLRPRRLRRTPALRALVRETRLTVDDLIQPLFVVDGDGPDQPIASLPGQCRRSIPALVARPSAPRPTVPSGSATTPSVA